MPEPVVVPNPVVVPAGGTPPAPVIPPAAPSSFDWGTVDPALKTEKGLAKFSGKTEKELLGHVGRAYIELDKAAGGMVRIPGADAKPEDVAAFHTKLGVPEKPEGYTDSKTLGIIPEQFQASWDNESEARFRSAAHKAGLTPAQYKAVMTAYIGETQANLDKAISGSLDGLQAAQEALSAKWGGNYKRNLSLSQRTTQSFDSPDREFGRLLESEIPGVGKLGNHPAYLAWAARGGEAMLEGRFISGEDLTTSKGDAQKELTALNAELAANSTSKTPMTKEDRMTKVNRTLELQKLISGSI